MLLKDNDILVLQHTYIQTMVTSQPCAPRTPHACKGKVPPSVTKWATWCSISVIMHKQEATGQGIVHSRHQQSAADKTISIVV